MSPRQRPKSPGWRKNGNIAQELILLSKKKIVYSDFDELDMSG